MKRLQEVDCGTKSAFDLAILGAVPREIIPLTELLKGCRGLPLRGQTIWRGKIANLSVLLGTTGLGKVNAAITTASLLEHFPVARVWNVGCSGAFPEGPLQIGDVLITDSFLCGDEGILTRDGPLPVSAIGIPLCMDRGEELFDYFPRNWDKSFEAIVNKTPPGRYGKQEEGFHLFYGPSLTVSMTSGDPATASERYRCYGAFAENMEGSAVAQTCLRFRVPLVECRGMSNLAGVRAKETWRMEKSIAHCHRIVINWLEILNALKSWH